DEQAVLDQLSAQLTRRFGATHRVECAESAEEALALIDDISAAGDEVELVICDQVMPKMKGDAFLERIYETRPRVMRILLTGQAALWHGAGSLSETSRRGVEASLVRLRSEGRSGPPPGIAAAQAVALEHGQRLFGWLLVLEGPEPAVDTREFLSILAGQAAAGLQHVELLEERLRGERLSTIGRMIATIVHDFRNPMTAIK